MAKYMGREYGHIFILEAGKALHYYIKTESIVYNF